ncbi:MAG: hypothetical protein V1725_06240 [archaeon]
METKPLATVIMAVIIAVLLLGMLAYSIATIKKFEDRDKCRLTSWAQANSQYQPGIAGIIPGPKFDLGLRQDCPTYYVTFTKDKVTERKSNSDDTEVLSVYDSTRGKLVQKYKQLTPDMVNSVVAEQMRYCYYQFWEGKVPVFYNKYTDINVLSTIAFGVVGVALTHANNVRCFPCAELHFSDSVDYDSNKGSGLSVQNLPETQLPPSENTASIGYYLVNRKGKNMNSTYFDYLNSYNGYCQLTTGKQGSCLAEELNDMDIDPYLVLEKDKYYKVLLIRRGEERDEYTITSYVVPADREAKICTEGMVS